MAKWLRVLIVTPIVIILIAPAQAQNLLTNPGLELFGIAGGGDDVIPEGWEMNESIVQTAANGFETLAEPAFYGHRKYTGDGCNDIGRCWNMWFKPYVGTFTEINGVKQEDNFAHLYQDVPGTAGMRYTMTGFAAFENHFAGGVANLNWQAGDPGVANPDPNVFNDGRLSPTDMFFALEFLDSMGSVLPGSTQLELRAAGQVNQTSGFWNNSHWTQHTLVAVAPAGTAEVRVRASMIDGVVNPAADPQSAFIDGFSLTAEEVPGIPGDFDGDLDVDGRDFLTWQRGSSPSPLSASDLAVWKSNFGSPLLALVAVPEPTTSVIAGALLVSSLCLTGRRRVGC